MQKLRDAKGLSQEDLEELSGVSRSTIAKCESGKTTPGSDTLEKLAVALDATMGYFYERDYKDLEPAAAAAQMAYAVFAADPKYTQQHRDRCRRALAHKDAPKTAKAWRSLSEMVDMVIGPVDSRGQLELLKGKPKRK